MNRPALVLAHNKTLAAQLYQEFKAFFPENAVEYFVSYYDYYQPEAYVPQSDTYIEKESTINDEIDRMRLSRHPQPLRAARRGDRGLRVLHLRPGLAGGLLRHAAVRAAGGDPGPRRSCCPSWWTPATTATTSTSRRGTFRVRGDVIEIVPAYEETGIRIELFGDEVEPIASFDPLTGKTLGRLAQVAIYPSSHYVTPRPAAGGRAARRSRRS